MTPDYWEQAKTELCAADDTLAKLIQTYQGEMMRGRGDAFYTLCRSIVGQQISVKAADAVWDRFETQMNQVIPANVLKSSEEELRACGLSRQKVLYLNEIAVFFDKNNVDDAYFTALDDEEAIKNLVSIKGVGRWTAEMFLIFHLLRPNVFPIDDLGVQKSIEMHYNRSEKMDKKQMRKVAEIWHPWRTVATWYLWRALDPVPVAY